MEGLMAVWKDIQKIIMCYSEHDNRSVKKMKETKNVLTSSAVVKNGYNEFTTFFRIPHMEGEIPFCDREALACDILGAWHEVLITALNLRMDSCVSMLFRNRDNVLRSTVDAVWFKKKNGHIHCFNFAAFAAMQEFINSLRYSRWHECLNNTLGIYQLQKALYWIPEDMRQDHGGFSFGELISCLEEATLISNPVTEKDFNF